MLFLIVIISPNFAQNTDLNVFKIIKSEIRTSDGKSYYNQTCINNNGLTIYFKGPEFTPHTVKATTNSKIRGVISINIDPFKIGSNVYADFTKGIVYPMINNTIDYSKSYSLSFGSGSETEGFKMISGFTNSPMRFFINHLSCNPEYPVLTGTVYRHISEGWSPPDSNFTLHPDIADTIPVLTGSGWYDIDILGVRVRNVVLFAHTSTRIKAGVLNISSATPWSLHSESGNKTIYSSSQPKMVEFPTGIYQLDINGSRKQIEIKDALILDAETNEYRNSNLVEENSKWRITNPPDPDPAIPSMNLVDRGIILLHREAGAEGSLTVAEHTGVLMWVLSPGMYTVIISGVHLVNVPICNGCCTRIKAGALNVNSNLQWILSDTNKVTLYTGYSSKKVEFPVGKYQLEVNELLHQVEIKDGETLNFNDSTPGQTQRLNTGTQPWEIKMDPTIKGVGGEITLQMPKELRYNTHMEFYDAGDAKKPVASWFENNKAKLLPGLYNIVVDKKYTIQNVPVELGKQTRLKMGVFMVSSYGSYEIENSNHQKFTYAPPFKILLPEGTYYINGKKKTPVVIKDGELTEL